MSNNGADIAVLGLAVMGQNLALNIADNGFDVAVYNRTTSTMREFLDFAGTAVGIRGYENLEGLVQALARPRKLLLMVKAGRPVDLVAEALLPLLDEGDILIDGGNSYWRDTQRRERELAENGIRFMGCGISGGEEGARHGPSIMPGGPRVAWEATRDILRAIAAEAEGEPCADWLGEGGAGHFVKMVHNGIEYSDMQLIAESYHVMQQALGMTAPEMREVFTRWDEGRLDSYLIEITRDILGTYDGDGNLILDLVLDAAKQKGTGRWTSQEALELGVPLASITEAVFARVLSALKDERVHAAGLLTGPETSFNGNRDAALDDLRDALYASKIVSYAQGFMLLKAAAEANQWSLELGLPAKLWRAGCIIRSRFLEDITAAFREQPDLQNLLLAPWFRDEIARAQAGWRRTVSRAVTLGIPTPGLSSSLAFYDGYRHARLPANLIQAQRDYFGAHTYERADRPRGETFHTDWMETGGTAQAGSYEA